MLLFSLQPFIKQLRSLKHKGKTLFRHFHLQTSSALGGREEHRHGRAEARGDLVT